MCNGTGSRLDRHNRGIRVNRPGTACPSGGEATTLRSGPDSAWLSLVTGTVWRYHRSPARPRLVGSLARFTNVDQKGERPDGWRARRAPEHQSGPVLQQGPLARAARRDLQDPAGVAEPLREEPRPEGRGPARSGAVGEPHLGSWPASEMGLSLCPRHSRDRAERAGIHVQRVRAAPILPCEGGRMRDLPTGRESERISVFGVQSGIRPVQKCVPDPPG